MNLVDYAAASTRDKERIDLLVTTNSTGRPGCCIPIDMCCEHKVRQAKDLFRSFNSQLEVTLIKKAILAQNSTHIMKEHWIDCFGKGDMKTGGTHRHDHMSFEEKEFNV